MGSLSENKIPIIDISPFSSPGSSPEAKDRIVRQVSNAVHTYGFFYLVGHAVPKEAQQRVLSCGKLFFDLPLEEKMKISVDKSLGKCFRGYEPSRIQTHQKGFLPDTKETFITGAEVPATDPDAGTFSIGPNLWPTSLPDADFRNPVMQYRDTMQGLAKLLTKILALGLPKEWNCPPNVFDELNVKPSIPMRLLHYAPEPEVRPNQFGVGDHTDFGCVSILLQEAGTEGLEVWYPPTETWIPVPVVEHAFVVNIGDTMHRWTNGYYRSARHRVILSSQRRRYSCAFFLNGNLKLNIKPLDGTGEETSISEYIRSRLAHTLGENGTYLN